MLRTVRRAASPSGMMGAKMRSTRKSSGGGVPRRHRRDRAVRNSHLDARQVRNAYRAGERAWVSTVREEDPNGNVTTYAYDALNRLTGVTYPDMNGVAFQYDAEGNRTLLVYPDGKRVQYRFDAAGRLVEVEDRLGGRTAYACDAFGSVGRRTGTTPNPFGYVGRHGLTEEGGGLLYARARYYAPRLGRFLAKDTMSTARRRCSPPTFRLQRPTRP